MVEVVFVTFVEVVRSCGSVSPELVVVYEQTLHLKFDSVWCPLSPSLTLVCEVVVYECDVVFEYDEVTCLQTEQVFVVFV